MSSGKNDSTTKRVNSTNVFQLLINFEYVDLVESVFTNLLCLSFSGSAICKHKLWNILVSVKLLYHLFITGL